MRIMFKIPEETPPCTNWRLQIARIGSKQIMFPCTAREDAATNLTAKNAMGGRNWNTIQATTKPSIARMEKIVKKKSVPIFTTLTIKTTTRMKLI